jgi:hypothetical protein
MTILVERDAISKAMTIEEEGPRQTGNFARA